MPRYSPEIIQDVRMRMNIVDVVSRYVHLEKKGANYFGLCPFHNEKSPSFSVNPDREMYKCFGCGKAGDVFSFVMEVENMTFPEAVEKLAGECGVTLPKTSMSQEERKLSDKRQEMYAINKDAAIYFYQQLRTERGKRALEYFHSRKLTNDTITHWGLGYSSQVSDDLYKYLKEKGYSDDLMKESGLASYSEKYGWHDKFWNRAMFPIFNAQQQVIGFGGRVMGDGEPKYLNTQETLVFDKSRNLFGLQFARKSRRKEFILCEGYMDVISMHQAGFDNTVASLGTALTEQHAQMLKKYKRPIYLSYDSDGAGVKAALRAIDIFKKMDVTVKVINMRPYKDPDEFIKALGAEEYEKRILDAENSFLYKVRMKRGDYDLEDPEERTAFQTYMADLIIQEFDTELERSNYISELCRIYHMPENAFRELIAHEAAQGVKHETQVPKTIEELPNQRRRREKPADRGRMETERLLLSWMAERQDIWNAVRDYVEVQDFQEGTRRMLAEAIYDGWSRGEQCKAVQFLDQFDDPMDRDEVAGIFHLDAGIETPDDWNRALRETILRVLRDGTEKELQEAQATHADDPELFRKSIALKKKQQMLRTHDFHITG